MGRLRPQLAKLFVMATLWLCGTAAGLAGPPGLPGNIVKTVVDASRETLKDPLVIAKLAKIGLEPFYLPGDQFRKFVFDEVRSIKSLKKK
jgi:tripartite-type tricarboxylate transporter receptor subunit TctC